MSKRSLIVWLVLALGLALGALYATRPPKGAPGASGPVAWLSSLESTPPDRIEFAFAGGQAAVLSPSEPAKGWVLERRAPGSGAAIWPASDEPVRGFLRLMGELASVPADPAASVVSGTRVTLSIAGRTRTIRLADAPFAGRLAADIEQDDGSRRPIFVHERLSRVLTPAGLAEWRRPNLIGRTSFQPARVWLEGDQRRVALERSSGRYRVVEPFRVECDAGAFSRLAGSLTGLRFERALDSGEMATLEATMGLDRPARFLRVMTPHPDDPSSSLVEEVTIGAPADVAGRTRFARARAFTTGPSRMDQPAWGPAVGLVSAADLAGWDADPLSLVSRRAVAFVPADVSSITLERWRGGFDPSPGDPPASDAERHEFTRQLSAWEHRVGTLQRPTSDADAQALEGLVRILCGVDASIVQRDVPDGAEPLARAQVRGLRASPDAPAGELVTIGLAKVEGRTHLVVRTTPLTRLYDTTGLEQLSAWLVATLKVEG